MLRNAWDILKSSNINISFTHSSSSESAFQAAYCPTARSTQSASQTIDLRRKQSKSN